MLKKPRKGSVRRWLQAILVTATAALFLLAMLTAAADLERPVPYTPGLVTARLAEDTAIDIDYHGGNYAAFYGFHRELNGRPAVFFCCTKNLRAAVSPRKESHIVIGNGLFTDFETGRFEVPRQIDAVYYLAGDYDSLPTLPEEEFQTAAASAALIWERN